MADIIVTETKGNSLKHHATAQMRPGPKLRMPSDKSVISEMREAMRAFPENQHQAAKALTMGYSTFSFIRKLILLNDKLSVSRDDRAIIQNCLEVIEKDRQIGRILNAGEEVISRNWKKRKDPPYVTSTRTRRFDQTITAIHESCESTVEMVLPDLNKDEVLAAIGELSRSAELINRLMRKLTGEPTLEEK